VRRRSDNEMSGRGLSTGVVDDRGGGAEGRHTENGGQHPEAVCPQTRAGLSWKLVLGKHWAGPLGL
jgi:hypothetical protein